MVGISQLRISRQYRKIRRKIMANPRNVQDVRQQAYNAYQGLIGPMHDWGNKSVGQFARRISVAARLKSDFELRTEMDHFALDELLHTRRSMLWKLPDETIVLLRYLVEDIKLSWSVYLEHEMSQIKTKGRRTYLQTHVLGPVGA